MSFPKLFKISGIGKVQEWSIDVVKKMDGSLIVINHGQVDGAITENGEFVSRGMNIGKKNETTPHEQALLQAQSRWNKQIDRGYRETVEEAEKAAKLAYRPMLAHKWVDKSHTFKIGDEYCVQPKLDGMRCIATKHGGVVTLKSRSGKPILCMPHIIEECECLMEDGDTWDGELYKHGMEFETLMSICRKKKPDPRHREMEYHVFDVVGEEHFYERTADLNDALKRVTDFVKFVPAIVGLVVDDDMDKKVDEFLKVYEDQGYEGVIFRRVDLPYEHKRSKQLLKLKTFIDAEWEVLDSLTGAEGTNKEGLLMNFVCLTDPEDDEMRTRWSDLTDEEKMGEIDKRHRVFKAPLMGSEDLLREMWERRDSYVGELAVIKFQEKTKFGVPRFPKAKGVRGREDLSS